MIIQAPPAPLLQRLQRCEFRSQIIARALLCFSILVAISTAAICAPSLGQAEDAPRKRFEVRRTRLEIKIDGVLDDEAWAEAVVDDSFRQVNPDEGAEPTERTELRVLHDGEYLYVGVRMYDSDPSAIIAKQMVLDGRMTSDDRINLSFDTFNDQRNAFFFQINSAGTRGDAQIENNSNFRSAWNGIWQAEATVDEQGWTAEFAIPFKTVAYAADGDGVWGFECERIVRRKAEMTRWGTYSRNRTALTMAGVGLLVGLTDLDGTGVDVKPSGSLRQTRKRNRSDSISNPFPTDRDNDTLLKGSGDIFYKFHPSITAGVTLNTDFLETPADDQRNILTRFPAFLPERRAFFLQDAGIFEFASLNGSLLLPFRSRSIGRRNGEPVRIDGGAKLSGRIGDASFGGLYVHLPAEDGVGATNLAVVRGQLNVLDGSAVGFIGTIGERNDENDNGLFGVDFQYFDRLPGLKILSGNAYFLQTITDGSTANAQAFGLNVEYPNDRYSGSLAYSDVGQEFSPGLGGVLRPGIRKWTGNFRYRVRPGNWLRTADTKVGFDIVTNRAAELETATATFDFLTLENNVGDILSFAYTRRFEHLRRQPFEPSGVLIPLGRYTFARYGARLSGANSRAVQPTVEVVWGTFFSGKLLQINGKLEFRPSRHLFLGLEYEQNEGHLAEGNFIQRLARVRVTLAFTPEISWSNVLQYDNTTDRMGLNSIFRWQVEPGNDIFLVFNYDWDEVDGELVPQFTEVAIKVAWTFRF